MQTKIALPLHAPAGTKEDWPGQLGHWLNRLVPMGAPVVMITTRNDNGTDNVQLNAWILVTGKAPEELFLFVGTEHCHTAQNALRTGEWVVNLPPRRLGDHIFDVVRHNQPGQDELKAAGFTATPAEKVDAARVAEATACFECSLVWHRTVAPGLILLCGQVVAAAADPAVIEGKAADRVAAVDLLYYLPAHFNLAQGRLEASEHYAGLTAAGGIDST